MTTEPLFLTAHRAWLAVALVAVGCGSAPPPKAPVEEAPLDLGPASSATTTRSSGGSATVPRQLVGASLQASPSSMKLVRDPHPADGMIPGRIYSWFMPKKPQALEGAKPTSTHFAFASNQLTAIVVFFKGHAPCKSVQDGLESHYGSPTQKTALSSMVMLVWQSGSATLNYQATLSQSAPDDEQCNVSLEDTPAELTALASEPSAPLGQHVDHFGTAKLLASKSSFEGLTLKEKGDNESEWYVPASTTYHGIALSRLSYKFQHGVLANVGFDSSKFADCPKLLSILKNEYGKADEHSNSYDGTSYDWLSPGGKLTFNMFTSQKTCGGILYALDPGDTVGSPFSQGGSTSGGSKNPFETSSPDVTRIVQ
jgi:hypothetical protein